MPPRHRKEIADEVNPPELDDSRKQIAEKDWLHRPLTRRGWPTPATLVRASFVVVLVLVNVSGFRLVLARGGHGRTPSLSGNDIGRSCFRISAMTCREWSACVRWRLSPSAAIVTQLVTALGDLASHSLHIISKRLSCRSGKAVVIAAGQQNRPPPAVCSEVDSAASGG